MNTSDFYLRQLDLVKPDELDFPISIIGAGGIGSWTTLALAKMGCQDIRVYDYDKVESPNVASQLYTPKYIGENKVDALKTLIKTLTDVEITPINSKFQEVFKISPTITPIIICAVDSMEERIFIWYLLMQKSMQQKIYPLYIDARMGGELLNINTAQLGHLESMQHYGAKLYPPTQVHQEICTAKAIVYNTFLCGGLIASIVKKFVKKEFFQPDITFDIKNGQLI